MASAAKVGVRQLLVVGVAPLMNELSLLGGFLFAALLFRSLLLSCHIVLLLYFSGYDRKILCSSSSCGLEKTAHNMLLYKLKLIRCQYFITSEVKYFSARSALAWSLRARRRWGSPEERRHDRAR